MITAGSGVVGIVHSNQTWNASTVSFIFQQQFHDFFAFTLLYNTAEGRRPIYNATSVWVAAILKADPNQSWRRFDGEIRAQCVRFRPWNIWLHFAEAMLNVLYGCIR